MRDNYFDVIPEEFASVQGPPFSFWCLGHFSMSKKDKTYRRLINLVGRTIHGPNVNKCNQRIPIDAFK